MKREQNDLDLRGAFSPMPQECHEALMTAARSVKEEEPVKRASFRAVLIAALIIAATMAVAIAAQQLGWVDFFGSSYNVAVPQAAQEVLEATKPQSFEVGPMTFTYKQLLADGHIGMSTAEIRTTDGSEAIYAPDNDFGEAVDALTDTIREKYHLEPGTTWAEAAQQLNLPLYGVRALIEVDESFSGGEAMEDPLWNEDGTIVYFSMPATNPSAVKDTLPVTLYMAVTHFDPETGKEVPGESWRVREQAEIPVSAMLAEKTYQPEAEATLNGLKLEGVRAEQYVTGVYLYSTFAAPEGMDEDAAIQAAYDLTFLGADGTELPHGINLSGYARTNALPTLVLETMISAESLPDSMTLTDGTVSVTVK